VDGVVDASGDPGEFPAHRIEVSSVHNDGGHRRDRGDGRGPSIVLNERDLPEEVSRPELDEMLPVPDDVTVSIHKREEFMGEGTLIGEVVPAREIDHVGPSRHGAAFLAGESLEQRDTVELLRVHRPP